MKFPLSILIIGALLFVAFTSIQSNPSKSIKQVQVGTSIQLIRQNEVAK